MSDRELLELAAKAYWGDEIDDVCSVEWSEPDQAIAYTHADNQDHNGIDQTFIWNPLFDEGAALRLAVTCGIEVGNAQQYRRGLAIYCGKEYWEADDDLVAATRRAIVRAAAAIGATQEESGK